MPIMQMVVVACLGMENTPGRSEVKPRKESLENVLSRRGMIKCNVKMVIFKMSKHIENGSIGTGSTKQRSGRWIHLIRSYE